MTSFLFNSILFLDATAGASTVTSGVSDIANGSSSIASSINDNGLYPTLFAIMICLLIALGIFLAYTIVTSKRKLQDEVDKNRENDRTMLNGLIKEILQNYLEQHPLTVNKPANPTPQQSQVNTNSKSNNTSATSQNIQQSSSNQQSSINDYHNDIVGAYIKVSLELKDICRTVDLKLGCSRVAIYVFHNGNSSLYGLPFFKMSCISEYMSHSDIHTMRGRTHIDMPLHIFNDIVETLYRNNVYLSQNIEETAKNDDCIEEFVRYSNVKALIAKGIDNKDGALAGFIVAEFADVDTFETDEKRYDIVMDVLKEASGSAKVLIGDKYVYDKTSKKK